MSTVDQTTSVRTTVLRSSDFTCPSCVGKIEKKLRPLRGVISAAVHFSTGRVVVEHDPSVVSVDDLVTAVAQVGYRAVPSSF